MGVFSVVTGVFSVNFTQKFLSCWYSVNIRNKQALKNITATFYLKKYIEMTRAHQIQQY